MHRRKILAGLGALPALSVPALPTPAAAATREASPATFAQVVEEMTGGGELLLAGGDYGSVRLEGNWPAATPLVIRSRDPADPARLQELMIIYSRHVRLEQLVFDYRFRAGDPRYHRPFQIRDSADIAIRGGLFDGDLAGPGAEVSEGFGTGFGLSIRAANDIEVFGNEFRGFGRGLVVSQSSGLVLRGNDLHSLRMDGMNFAEVQNVVIEGNHIHDFARDVDGGDHADMIQFWTNGTTQPSRSVRIRGNLLNAGQGWYTQSIFMRNDEVDTGKAGPEMFYRDIEISDNVILNAHLHGITVGETRGLAITNNTVVRNARAEGRTDNPILWTPQIRIAPASRDVTVSRNVTSKVVGFEGQSDWWIEQNMFVQDRFRMEPGFYGRVFVREVMTDPTRPEAFAPLPGGPLDGTGIGATWLEPGMTGPPRRL